MAAIYQWMVNQQVLTTTLYPIEAIEYLQLSITGDSFAFDELPQDYAQFSIGITELFKEEILIYAGPYEDTAQFAIAITELFKERILWDTGPYDDTGQFAIGLADIFKESKLVTAYSPDQMLQLSIVLDTENSLMEAA